MISSLYDARRRRRRRSHRSSDVSRPHVSRASQIFFLTVFARQNLSKF